MIAWAVAAVAAAIAALFAWLRSRDKRIASADAWKASAGAEKARGDGNAAVVVEQKAEALETQTALEKEIHDADTARMAQPDPGARRRVQEGWRHAAADPADVPPGVPVAVPDAAAGRSGPGTAIGSGVRGKR